MTLAMVMTLATAGGCREVEEAQPGLDGHLPGDVVIRALEAANRQQYQIASTYLAGPRRRELELKYRDQGGMELYWDYMTSMHSVAEFRIEYVKPSAEGQFMVVWAKTRTDDTTGPTGHFRVGMERGNWRITK